MVWEMLMIWGLGLRVALPFDGSTALTAGFAQGRLVADLPFDLVRPCSPQALLRASYAQGKLFRSV